MLIAAWYLFREKILSEGSVNTPCGSWVFDFLFSLMMVNGQLRHGVVSLVSGGWIAGIYVSL